jgi:hypothetical protein
MGRLFSWMLSGITRISLVAYSNSLSGCQQESPKSGQVNYATHSPDRINFVPGIDLLPRFENDYKLMQTQIIYGEPPEYAKLLESLRTLRWRFRAKKPIPLPYSYTLEDVVSYGKEIAEQSDKFRNVWEMTFISVPVHYRLDIYKPSNSANVDRSYRVSFIFTRGRLVVDDVQTLSVK